MTRYPIDTECYPNFWLFGALIGGKAEQVYCYGPGSRLSPQAIKWMVDFLAAFPVATFNGLKYDYWMICAAAAGYTVEQLKMVNDKLIVPHGAPRPRPWDWGIPRVQMPDHIDVMEVIPGAGGQKYKAGIIHYKTMRDLPYSPSTYLSPDQARNVAEYNGNDLGQLDALQHAVAPQIALRERLSAQYVIDVRSKSDAQVAEAILVRRCELALDRNISKREPDWDIAFRYEPPAYINYTSQPLRDVLEIAASEVFRLAASGAVALPKRLEGATVTIGNSTYRLGIGGLHSSESRAAHVADADTVLMDIDVESYYPSLILNSGKYPHALGEQFAIEYAGIKAERLAAKHKAGELEAAGDHSSDAWLEADTLNSGGKIMINGTFGKTGSIWSPLFAPEMLIQTTLTGQLSLLMLIERMEAVGVSVVSANTDGIVIKCKRDKLPAADLVIRGWEAATNLNMERNEYAAIYSRDVNSYIAIKANGKVKRKGEYAQANLIMKKAPDCEICADACAEYLAHGVPVELTVTMCDDIRKFVKIQNVSGGAVKMWGDGPRKDAKVRDMIPVLERFGWRKQGRGWYMPGPYAPDVLSAAQAYARCYEPQREEPLGKVIRWYYGTDTPGPIKYGPDSARPGALVSESWGAAPCMELPDTLPANIDYARYIARAKKMLRDCGAIV